jgi:hypothetical protein
VSAERRPVILSEIVEGSYCVPAAGIALDLTGAGSERLRAGMDVDLDA